MSYSTATPCTNPHKQVLTDFANKKGHVDWESEWFSAGISERSRKFNMGSNLLSIF